MYNLNNPSGIDPNTVPPYVGSVGSWWGKLVGFVFAVLAGGARSISIPVGIVLPAFSVEDNLNIFGRADIITLSANGSSPYLNFAVATAK